MHLIPALELHPKIEVALIRVAAFNTDAGLDPHGRTLIGPWRSRELIRVCSAKWTRWIDRDGCFGGAAV